MTNLNYQSGAIDASGCFSTAWALVQRNLGMYIGVGLVTWLMISCIPCANMFLLGPVMGGFAYVVLRDLRNEPVEFGMMFKGFEKFLPLMVIGLIQMIPAILFQILQYSARFGMDTSRFGNDFNQSSEMNPLLAGMTAGLIIIFFGYMIFQMIWNAAFIFAIPLVLENDIGAVEAIKISLSAVFSNVGGIILLLILGFLVALLGAIAFCIGLLVAVPVIWVANVVAYRNVFPLIDGGRFTGPPPPTAYGSSFGQGM